MKFLMFLFLSLSVILISCGDDDNPTSPGDSTEPLLPLAVGNEWNYDFIQYNSGKTDTGFFRIYIDKSTQIEFKGENHTAYHIQHFSWGNLEAEFWAFTHDSKQIGVESLDDLESYSSSPNAISLEEAAQKPDVNMGGDIYHVDVSKIMVLDKETDCISMQKDPTSAKRVTYYKPGLGMVREDYTSLREDWDYHRSIVLKSYTLK